jgi:hypothetical protein
MRKRGIYLDQELLLRRSGTQSPSSGVGFTIHDDSLGLGNTSVVAGSYISGGHLGNSNSDSFTLGGDQNNFLTDLRN